MSAASAPHGSILARLEAACRDPRLCRKLLARLGELLDGRPMRFMEVCGTHTVAIFQSGLRAILPSALTHISGPGCPVCVTHEAEVALFLELARDPDKIIATFGDLLRVPGPGGLSLKHVQARGGRVEIVYSPLDCLRLAKNNPGAQVVFLGIGFETTAPTSAAALMAARKANIKNFSMLSMHKLVPPAIKSLLAESDNNIDAFLLPGHVATVTGLAPFEFIAAEYGKPAVAAGFEPADLLLALCRLAEIFVEGPPAIANAYPRAVAAKGNPRAMEMMNEIFEAGPARWRGLGEIPASGLFIRGEFADLDAMKRFDLVAPESAPLPGCLCGEVLKGRKLPVQCPLFGGKCSPANPLGPCMVSTEGSCAAHYKYGEG